MTFEEFFKKKKIDLAQLLSAEPALFAEFKNHYELMGEKSFDHTKKYWFNQLRHKYVPAPEIKAEKVIIENQLAEQTIIESLTEPASPAAFVGFKPRFKAASHAKSAEEKPVKDGQPDTTAPVEAKPAETTETKPAVGFKPRFKASMVARPAEEQPAVTPEPVAEKSPEVAAESETEVPKPAVGFKPRFKASMVARPAEEQPEATPEPVAEKSPEIAAESETEVPKPAVGFKPRFKASMVARPAEEQPAATSEPVAEQAPEPIAESKDETADATAGATEPSPSKPVGFKPRFNAAKMTKPKPPEGE